MPQGGPLKRLFLTALVLGLVATACSSDSTDTTATPATPATTATTKTPTTTEAEAPTTTAAPATTTAAPAGEPVAATTVVGVLRPYNEAGAALFPSESVEAHWYQWDGRYVLLYRGFDASDGTPMCPGNSTADAAGGYTSISNSPHNGEADEICIGANVVEAPSGAYACDSLLYYLTEIPTAAEGTLWGTLEFLDGNFAGQTSVIPIDLANTPEFEPGLDGYDLPPSGVDDGGVVMCG